MKTIENIRENIPIFSKRGIAPEELSHLETALEAALVPVSPRAEFVERLNRQLIVSAPLARKQSAEIVKPENKTRESFLIGVATLLGAAAIFATGFRVIFTVFGIIGFLMQLSYKKSAKNQSTAQPAV